MMSFIRPRAESKLAGFKQVMRFVGGSLFANIFSIPPASPEIKLLTISCVVSLVAHF